jgi:hypothetical protein
MCDSSTVLLGCAAGAGAMAAAGLPASRI